METLWQRLTQWAAQHAPDIAFNPGASAVEIDAAEAALGLRFPAELRAYLQLANGERWNSAGFIGDWPLLPLKAIVREALEMRALVDSGDLGDNAADPSPHTRGLWWNPAWIPLVTSGSGHLICVDLDPGPAGQVGQIILFLHDDSPRYRIAESLRAWFARLADDLERGLYHIIEDADGYRHFNGHAFLWSSLEGQDYYAAPPGEP